MIPMPIPCSRNAHDQNVLVRRPQWNQHGCHSMREKQASLEGSFRWRVFAQLRSGGQSRLPPKDGGWKVEEWATRASGYFRIWSIECKSEPE